MIIYILFSYIIMAVFFIVRVREGRDTAKSTFKWWLFSPVVLPMLIVVRFVQW